MMDKGIHLETCSDSDSNRSLEHSRPDATRATKCRPLISTEIATLKRLKASPFCRQWRIACVTKPANHKSEPLEFGAPDPKPCGNA